MESGERVMKLLLNQRGQDVIIIEGIVKAVGGYRLREDELIILLLD